MCQVVFQLSFAANSINQFFVQKLPTCHSVAEIRIRPNYMTLLFLPTFSTSRKCKVRWKVFFKPNIGGKEFKNFLWFICSLNFKKCIQTSHFGSILKLLMMPSKVAMFLQACDWGIFKKPELNMKAPVGPIIVET